MFGLFKRTKIEAWEIEMLLESLKSLPHGYEKLTEQVQAGIFRGVLIGASDIPGYNAFTFNSKVFSKFSEKNVGQYKITGITVPDINTKTNLQYTIYVSSGVINGYSLNNRGKFKLDAKTVNTEKIKIEYIKNLDYEKIKGILTPDETQLVSVSDVYNVSLNNKTYFHLIDLGDGDFIGIDLEKNVYKITHDPFEIIPVNGNLKFVLEHLNDFA